MVVGGGFAKLATAVPQSMQMNARFGHRGLRFRSARFDAASLLNNPFSATLNHGAAMAKASTPTRPRGPLGLQSDMPPGKTRTRFVKSSRAKGIKSAKPKPPHAVGRRDRQP